MKKGFVISLTTFYFVVLFLVFLSIVIFTIHKPIYVDSQNNQTTTLYTKFVSNDPSVIISPSNNDVWCSEFYFFDAKQKSNGFNPLIVKKYCVSYNGKRFV